MNKKHLIIGYGNMGKRHGHCLEELGHSFESYDFERDGFRDRYEVLSGDYASVIICTPPGTHEYWIKAMRSDVPVFVEKPIVDYIDRYDYLLMEFFNGRITMVACNWRFCSCINFGFRFLFVNYKSKDSKPYLDLVHFTHLFDLTDTELIIKGNNFSLRSRSDPKRGIVGIGTDSDVGNNCSVIRDMGTGLSSEMIHTGEYCDMFLNQMRHWLDCIENNKPSINPFRKAYNDTKWLLDSYKSLKAKEAA